MAWLKAFFVTLFAASLFTACDAFVHFTRPNVPTNYEYVCIQVGEIFDKYNEVKCRRLDEPLIVESTLFDGALWYGAYVWGEPYVFIQANLGEIRDTVVQHEMAHYVLDNLNLVERGDACEHERLARLISAGDFDEWDEQTQRLYGCYGTPTRYRTYIE